jgi:hypothetical protein
LAEKHIGWYVKVNSGYLFKAVLTPYPKTQNKSQRSLTQNCKETEISLGIRD